MRHFSPQPAPDERGFILVGVVTFMLALTILGLSLFALSSYEGQFFASSASREQALQDSESGMELVQALLASPNSDLHAAHQAEGQLGITSAMAYQRRSVSWTDTTSSGPVNWDSTLVIVVSARRGGIERTLLAQFMAAPAQNPYQRLMAAGQGITCNTHQSTDPVTMQLNGQVWQPVASPADTAWTHDVRWDTGRPLQRGTPTPVQADAFVNSQAGFAPMPASDYSDNNNYVLTFSGSATNFTSFQPPFDKPHARREEDDPEFGWYSFYAGADVTIDVSGVVVWLVPHGACFKDQVIVRAIGGVPSTLVIVARPGSDPNDLNRALWFKGGLHIPNHDVSVFLVSQGDISLVHLNDENRDHDASAVSIVAGGWIEIGGTQGSNSFKLGYDPAMDALADQLLARHALPPLLGGTLDQFTLVRPSWTEITSR